MSIMEAVRAYIRTYPPLTGDKINVDFLDHKNNSYTVDSVPSNGVVKTYMDGSQVCQFLFILASREAYGGDILTQIENLGFYEDFARWLDENSRKGRLPLLEGGCVAQEIGATTSGYAFTAEGNKARYQIQCRLIYLKKRSE